MGDKTGLSKDASIFSAEDELIIDLADDEEFAFSTEGKVRQGDILEFLQELGIMEFHPMFTEHDITMEDLKLMDNCLLVSFLQRFLTTKEILKFQTTLKTWEIPRPPNLNLILEQDPFLLSLRKLSHTQRMQMIRKIVLYFVTRDIPLTLSIRDRLAAEIEDTFEGENRFFYSDDGFAHNGEDQLCRVFRLEWHLKHSITEKRKLVETDPLVQPTKAPKVEKEITETFTSPTLFENRRFTNTLRDPEKCKRFALRLLNFLKMKGKCICVNSDKQECIAFYNLPNAISEAWTGKLSSTNQFIFTCSSKTTFLNSCIGLQTTPKMAIIGKLMDPEGFVVVFGNISLCGGNSPTIPHPRHSIPTHLRVVLESNSDALLWDRGYDHEHKPNC